MRPLPAVAAILLAAPAHAGVLIASGDAAAVQASINAAADGDIVLIKPGSGGDYGELIVDGKSLTLVVDGGDYDISHVVLRNLPPGGQIVVRGLSVVSQTLDSLLIGPELGALDVRDCAGAVWIDECTIEATYQMSFIGAAYPGTAGLIAVDSPNVTVSDCTITGGHGTKEFPGCTPGTYVLATVGGPGVSALGSRVALLDVTATGGIGGAYINTACSSKVGAAGGPGLWVDEDSIVHASGCTLLGAPDAPNSKQAGSGLEMVTGAVTLRDSVALAGAGGPPVPDIIPGSGTLATSATPARGLSVSSPLRVGQAGALDFEGLADDTVAVFESVTGGWTPLPGKEGVFLLGAPLLGPVFVAPNPVGDWSIPFTTPPVLPPGTLGQTVLLQLLVKSGPQVTIEDVASCTLLDATVP